MVSKRLGRSKVHILSDVETGFGKEGRELPFVVGVMGDFAGDASQPASALCERDFQDIDIERFDQVMRTMHVGLHLRISNLLSEPDEDTVEVRLKFESMKDFEPLAVAHQIEPFVHLPEARAQILRRIEAPEPGHKRSEVPGRSDTSAPSSRQPLAGIDAARSSLLAAVMHHRRFQQLEASWRGLHHLILRSEAGPMLQVRVLHCTKTELAQDLLSARSPEQSHVHGIICDEHQPRAALPCSLLIGDYEFDPKSPQDLTVLTDISVIASTALAPFITSPSPGMLDLDSWAQLLDLSGELEQQLDQPAHREWNTFRASPHSRYIVMVLPRTLARLPYTARTDRPDDVLFDETKPEGNRISSRQEQNQLCWMNSAFVLGGAVTSSFTDTHWPTSIIGVGGGGKVEGLPAYLPGAVEGETESVGPLETTIPLRLESRLSQCGFVPFMTYSDIHGCGVFLSSQTLHKSGEVDPAHDRSDATIHTSLPCVLAASRFGHYLRFMIRKRGNETRTAEEIKAWLEGWVAGYTHDQNESYAELQAKYPLRQAKIGIEPASAGSSSWNVILEVLPWQPTGGITMATHRFLRSPFRLVIPLPQSRPREPDQPIC